jgi:hypothetical protein
MGSSSKQPRKKTDKSSATAAAPVAAAATSSSTTSTATTTTNNDNNNNNSKKTDKEEFLSLGKHLDRAQALVEQNRLSTLTLHQQWRTQLLNMAYLVMVVTLHLAQTPSSACIKDIKVREQEKRVCVCVRVRASGETLYALSHLPECNAVSYFATAALFIMIRNGTSFRQKHHRRLVC